MENQVIEAVTLAGSADNLDFSIWALFLRADPIVKSVIVLLLVASIWCWAIIIDKTITFRRTQSEMNRFERTFWSGQSLEELYRSLAEKKPTGSLLPSARSPNRSGRGST